MEEVIVATAAAILVCIQAHRNYLMVQAAKPKEDRAADALEKIYYILEKDSHLRDVDRKLERKITRR